MDRTLALLALGGFLVLAAGPAVAAPTAQTATITCGNQTQEIPLSDAIEVYNDNIEMVPDIIRPYVLSNTTELQIRNVSQGNYTIRANATGHITNVSVGGPPEPDVIVLTDRETACSIATADEPATAFRDAHESGEIEIEGTGTFNSAKVFVVEKVTGAVSYLSETVSELF